MSDSRPHILHVIHHLVIGGMENGLVNLINRLPADRYRHSIACIEDYSDFRRRIARDDVEVYPLYRSRIGVWSVRRQLYDLCRAHRPDILHTRNTSALDALLPARLAGVRRCLHGEHGRDVDDLNGEKWKPAIVRRLHSPLVSKYITVSQDLERYLINKVGIAPKRIRQIYNGVDTSRFNGGPKIAIEGIPADFLRDDIVVVGSVGRMQPVKGHSVLVRAFAELIARYPHAAARARLTIVGTGPLREQLIALTKELGIAAKTWFPGASERVPELLRNLDVFVLPSLGEGISNTILEAMATQLPVVASAVGGNVELVSENRTGKLFASGDVAALAGILAEYVTNDDLRRTHAVNARREAVEKFSIESMLRNYASVYDDMLAGN